MRALCFHEHQEPGKESELTARNSFHHGPSKSIERRPGASCPASQTTRLHQKSFFICTAVAATWCQVGKPTAAPLSRPVRRAQASGEQAERSSHRFPQKEKIRQIEVRRNALEVISVRANPECRKVKNKDGVHIRNMFSLLLLRPRRKQPVSASSPSIWRYEVRGGRFASRAAENNTREMLNGRVLIWIDFI